LPGVLPSLFPREIQRGKVSVVPAAATREEKDAFVDEWFPF